MKQEINKIKCPHCGEEGALLEATSDKLSWSIDSDNVLKELWLCEYCARYYFAYYDFVMVVPLVEGGG